jgi:hypothetical protein
MCREHRPQEYGRCARNGNQTKRPDLPGCANGHWIDMEPQDNSSAPHPDWAKGLKRLYDSVVAEPLPDVFVDLLARLDAHEPE